MIVVARTIAILPLLCAGAALAQQGAGTGPDPVVYRIEGNDHETLGADLVLLGDIDGDGVKDFAAGRHEDEANPNSLLRVDLFSGRNGALLRSLTASGGILKPVVPMPDIDGNGDPELGATGGFRLHVISPLTGKTWYTTPEGRPDVFARRKCAAILPDLDGDGIEEFAFGEMHKSDPDDIPRVDRLFSRGQVGLYSGKTGRRLWLREGRISGGLFGRSVLTSGDHDGDGAPDLLVGGSLDPGEEPVYVLSGRTGAVLTKFWPGEEFGSFGRAMISLGDRDGDGFPEVAISAPDHKPGPSFGGFLGHKGWVGIYQLPAFDLKRSFVGRDYNIGSLSGDRLGNTLSVAGDVDGDGVTDLLLATALTHHAPAPPVHYARLYVHSGATGAVLEVFAGVQQTFRNPFFGELSALGDTDGDGRDEFLVASPDETLGFGPSERFRAGTIRALRHDPSGTRFIRGDTNADGRVNITDAINIVVSLIDFTAQSCPAAYDVDASGFLDFLDVIYFLRYFFQARTGHFTPVPPYPECGHYTVIDPFPFPPELPCDDPGACAR
jgi:hypothetical protein